MRAKNLCDLCNLWILLLFLGGTNMTYAHGGELVARSLAAQGVSTIYTPVSYTHLDVYKRQISSCSSRTLRRVTARTT